MKLKAIIILIIFSTASSLTWAQSSELTPSIGYQFGTRLNYGPNYIQIDDSEQFSLTLAHELQSNLMGEITYMRHSTKLNIRDVIISPSTTKLSSLNADWILVGASKYFREDNVRPFAGLGMGLVFLTPQDENYDIISRSLDNETKFTFTFKAGTNIMLNDNIGINLQFNMFLPIEWGGVYVGGGSGGVSGGVSASGSTIIAGVSGGLVFRFGD